MTGNRKYKGLVSRGILSLAVLVGLGMFAGVQAADVAAADVTVAWDKPSAGSQTIAGGATKALAISVADDHTITAGTVTFTVSNAKDGTDDDKYIITNYALSGAQNALFELGTAFSSDIEVVSGTNATIVVKPKVAETITNGAVVTLTITGKDESDNALTMAITMTYTVTSGGGGTPPAASNTFNLADSTSGVAYKGNSTYLKTNGPDKWIEIPMPASGDLRIVGSVANNNSYFNRIVITTAGSPTGKVIWDGAVFSVTAADTIGRASPATILAPLLTLPTASTQFEITGGTLKNTSTPSAGAKFALTAIVSPANGTAYTGNVLIAGNKSTVDMRVPKGNGIVTTGTITVGTDEVVVRPDIKITAPESEKITLGGSEVTIIGRKTSGGSGNITINDEAWSSSLAVASTAIKTTGTTNGVSVSGYGISIRGGGKNVIVSAKGINVQDAEVFHYGAAHAATAVRDTTMDKIKEIVTFDAAGDVLLARVTVWGGNAISKGNTSTLRGHLIHTSGIVDIDGGTYYPMNGTVVHKDTKGATTVTITGARFTSAAYSGNVIEASSHITLSSENRYEATQVFATNTVDNSSVGAVYSSGGNIIIKAGPDQNAKVEISVAGSEGSGTPKLAKSGFGAAVYAANGSVSIDGFTDNLVFVTSYAGEAVRAKTTIKISDAVIDQKGLPVSLDDIKPAVSAEGSVAVHNFYSNSTEIKTLSLGANRGAIAVAAGDLTSNAQVAFILSGTITGTIMADKVVLADILAPENATKLATASVTNPVPSYANATAVGAVTIKADSVAIKAGSNVYINNRNAVISGENVQTTADTKIIEVGAITSTGAVEIIRASSITAAGKGRAIMMALGATSLQLDEVTVRSKTGSAIYSNGATVTLGAAGIGSGIGTGSAKIISSSSDSLTAAVEVIGANVFVHGRTAIEDSVSGSAIRLQASTSATVQIGTTAGRDRGPDVKANRGSAVRLSGQALVVVNSGTVSNKGVRRDTSATIRSLSERGLDAITISGGVVSASEVGGVAVSGGVTNVIINGEEDETGVSAAPYITASGNGNSRAIMTTGGDVTVSAVSSAAKTSNIISSRIGIVTTKLEGGEPGNVVVHNGTITADSIAILTTGGNITVDAELAGGSAVTKVEALKTGTAIRANAFVPVYGEPDAGIVSITSGVATNEVTVSAIGGEAVYSAGEVNIGGTVSAALGTVAISTETDTAIVAIGTEKVTLNGANVSVQAKGSATVNANSTSATAVAVAALNVDVKGGARVLGGSLKENTIKPEFAFTGIGIASRSGETGTISITNGSVIAYGPGKGISITNSNVAVELDASAANLATVEAGEGGTVGGIAIQSNGNVSVKVGKVVALKGAASPATARSVGIDATARTGNASVNIGNAGYVVVDSSATAIVSDSAVDVTVSGWVSARNGGTAINGKGSISLSGSAKVYIGAVTETGGIPTTVAFDDDAIGTAVNASGSNGDNLITISGTPIIKSRDVAFVSNNTRVENQVVIQPHATNAASVTGIINAKMMVNGGGLGIADSVIVAASKTLELANAGRINIASGKYLIIKGTVDAPANTVFENEGYVVIAETGNVNYVRSEATTFRNNAGTVALKKGSKLCGFALSDSARLSDSAKIFHEGGYRALSTAKAVVPPTFLKVKDLEFWGDTAATVATVYGGIDPATVGDLTLLMTDKYRGELKFSADSSLLPVGYFDGDKDPVTDHFFRLGISDAGELEAVILTRVGTYTFPLTVSNLAGEITKSHKIHVRAGTPEVGKHFSGVIEGGLYDGTPDIGTAVGYTGSPVAVGVVESRIKIADIDAMFEDSLYTGFGTWTITYEGVADEGTVYGPRSAAPTDVGKYKVTATMIAGTNFLPIATSAPVQLGELVIEPSELADVLAFQKITTDLDGFFTKDLPHGTAIQNVRVKIADLRPYKGTYTKIDAISPAIALVDSSASFAGDTAIVFSVNDSSANGDNFTFNVTFASATQYKNLLSNTYQVQIRYLDEAGLTENKPFTVGIDYVNEAIAGFDPGKKYRVSGGDSTVTLATGKDLAITGKWFGAEISVTALAMDEYRFDSDVHTFTIPVRPAAPTGLSMVDAVNGQNGQIVGTTRFMEYRRISGTPTNWARALDGATIVTNGTFEVRVRMVQDVNFAGQVATITVGNTGIQDADRVIPTDPVDEVTIVTPVKSLSAVFTAGPNPVAKSSGKVSFFWQGKAIAKSELSVFDAQGNLVKKVSVSETGSGVDRRSVGTWDLTDTKGRSVSEGTYLVRGVIKGTDGSKERVSYKLGVR